ncbi:RNA methyltransferase [Oryzomicrobium terrae]|uniref:tRNA (cytidine/uridine-2'-O-)-methyltransferase TrmJ n=1 Tax=Oryzomicrobium terrae TaxID=1735038 RepID=A0A5C1E7M1_9RHOO|nr:RNA methyltransferase [Oryzomicrobium terrae]QEL64873.1 RNA methyltransferase [Oryzomicrobium terrae]
MNTVLTPLLPSPGPVEAALARIRIVLCRPSHPGNIGAAARAMKTMGLTRLVLVSPKSFPDEEATTRAAGSQDVLEAAHVCATLDEALAGTVMSLALSARKREVGPPPLAAREAAATLVDLASRPDEAGGGEVALVFGNETVGLSNDEALRCSRLVTIPSNPAYSSLNLGAAVQLLAWEVRMAAYDQRPPESTVATPFSSPAAAFEDVEGFIAHLERVMIDSGFHNPAQPKRLMPKLRRLFARAGLERDEVNILRGLLAAVEAKMAPAKASSPE